MAKKVTKWFAVLRDERVASKAYVVSDKIEVIETAKQFRLPTSESVDARIACRFRRCIDKSEEPRVLYDSEGAAVEALFQFHLGLTEQAKVRLEHARSRLQRVYEARLVFLGEG